MQATNRLTASSYFTRQVIIPVAACQASLGSDRLVTIQRSAGLRPKAPNATEARGHLAPHPGDDGPAMQWIDLSTFGALLARKYELACYCPGCRRWATCDLGMLVRNGLGERVITETRP